MLAMWILETVLSFGRGHPGVSEIWCVHYRPGFLNLHPVSVEITPSDYSSVSIDVWLMPLECLHMTVLEVTHSKTEAEIEHLVSVMNNSIPRITDFTFEHRARLVKPMLSYDATAIALSFVPAASEMPTTSDTVNGNDYTYHHLRRDIYALSKGTGVEIASRYVVPSAHLTIARFVSQKDISGQNGMILDTAKVKKIVEGLETINIELETKHRPKGTGDWTVGEEKGLDCRKGRLWYGGGQTVHLGKGF